MFVEIRKRRFSHFPALFIFPRAYKHITKSVWSVCGRCGGRVGELLHLLNDQPIDEAPHREYSEA